MTVAQTGESVLRPPSLAEVPGSFGDLLNPDIAKEAIPQRVTSIINSNMIPEGKWDELIRVTSYDSEPHEHAQYYAELLKFARNGDPRQSVLLRAKALDSVMSQINHAVKYQPEVASYLDSATLQEYEDMKLAAPESGSLPTCHAPQRSSM